ncbi:MAG TPA: ribosome maturation factor RimP [Virgibacillus sp.]|nr:ribosome maturation factor RimP [Virgibacillus sp.]
MSSNVRETTERLIMPILDEKNFELVDVEYVKEGPDWFLRVYIDKAGGINIEECGLVSGELSDKLDKADIIPGHYFLEVSSPGVERPLKTKKDFKANVDHNIYVTLYVHIDGEKEYEGILIDFTDDVATIEYKVKTRTKQVEIPYDKIAKARLAVAL